MKTAKYYIDLLIGTPDYGSASNELSRIMAIFDAVPNKPSSYWKNLYQEIDEWLENEDVPNEEKEELLHSGYLEMLQMMIR